MAPCVVLVEEENLNLDLSILIYVSVISCFSLYRGQS